MKTEDRIIKFIEEKIHQIYRRPLMFGGSASGTNLLLFAYFEVWAINFGKLQEFKTSRENLLKDLNCGAADFSTKFRKDHPTASEKDIAIIIVEHWKKIGNDIGLSIPTIECIREKTV